MNKARRTRLSDTLAKISEALFDLEAIRDEEQDAFDNMPESIQQGEKGEKMGEGLDSLSDSLDRMNEALSDLEELANP